jgi:hypothetical protein
MAAMNPMQFYMQFAQQWQKSWAEAMAFWSKAGSFSHMTIHCCLFALAEKI